MRLHERNMEIFSPGALTLWRVPICRRLVPRLVVARGQIGFRVFCVKKHGMRTSFIVVAHKKQKQKKNFEFSCDSAVEIAIGTTDTVYFYLVLHISSANFDHANVTIIS